MTPTALVTGGAGFIGSHLCHELVKRDYRVIVLDDLSSGSLASIAPLVASGEATFIRAGINDGEQLQAACRGIRYVFHLAAIPGVADSLADPAGVNEVNIKGTLSILLAARDAGVEKLIFASSAAVYGDGIPEPLAEDAPTTPLSPYAVTKLAGEQYCSVFSQQYGLSTACLRFFNVYGPGQPSGAAVIPAFIALAREGKAMSIYGDGGQTRDFVSVHDVVSACIRAAESAVEGIFNIGSGQAATIEYLAELVSRLSRSTAEITHLPTRPGEVRYSVADISKAIAFGFRPTVSLEKGLAELTTRETAVPV